MSLNEGSRGAPDGLQALSLDEVLEARERRALRQWELLRAYGAPVLSLTLVSPGPVKDSRGRRRLMDLTEDALDRRLADAGWTPVAGFRWDGAAGPEAFRVLGIPPRDLKRWAVELESGLAWGRLLDADVVVSGPSGLPEPLSRGDLGLPGRTCLLCAGPAKACMREARHAAVDLRRAVLERIVRSAGCP